MIYRMLGTKIKRNTKRKRKERRRERRTKDKKREESGSSFWYGEGYVQLGVKHIFLFGAGKSSCPDSGALRKTKILLRA